MNLICKFFSHDYSYAIREWLICMRCGKSLDLRWIRRIEEAPNH